MREVYVQLLFLSVFILGATGKKGRQGAQRGSTTSRGFSEGGVTWGGQPSGGLLNITIFLFIALNGPLSEVLLALWKCNIGNIKLLR